MNSLNQVTRVVFNEENHTYLLDSKTYLKGVTTIMRENGLSPNYGGIAPEVLAHAAEMGSMAHKCIEDYCNGIPVETNSLIKSFKKLNLKINCCEYLITDYDSIASSIDLVADVEEGIVDLIDMKRTAEVHTDALAWQLGIYKFFFEIINPTIKVRNCYCLPIKKGLKDSIEKDVCQELVLIEPISEEEVNELVTCVQMGMPYEPKEHDLPNLPLSKADIDNLTALERNLANAELLVKQYKEQVELTRGKLLNYMVENKLDKMQVGEGEYSIRKATTRTSIDTKKLKEDFPELAQKYAVSSEVKASITYKIK